jgi:hypothetical protein
MLFSTRALGDENKLVLSTAALEYVKQLKSLMSVMMQNKRHLYVQDALALNGLEAGRSCLDEFQHQKALRPLADGSRSAKDSTRSQCQFGCENDTSDGSSES